MNEETDKADFIVLKRHNAKVAGWKGHLTDYEFGEGCLLALLGERVNNTYFQIPQKLADRLIAEGKIKAI